jgi:hypothetical protein
MPCAYHLIYVRAVKRLLTATARCLKPPGAGAMAMQKFSWALCLTKTSRCARRGCQGVSGLPWTQQQTQRLGARSMQRKVDVSTKGGEAWR